MTVWLARAGKYGEDEATALEKGIAIIGWREILDVSRVNNIEEMCELHRKVYRDKVPKSLIRSAAQLWAFAKRMQTGDIIILPLKTKRAIAIGRVAGNYKYRQGRHTRPVKWIRDDVPRSDFGQNLLYSFGAYMTVCQITRNNAEERILAILEGGKDPALSLSAK